MNGPTSCIFCRRNTHRAARARRSNGVGRSAATAISADGKIVGYLHQMVSGAHRAVATAEPVLLTVPSTVAQSEALGIAATGAIVGTMGTAAAVWLPDAESHTLPL